MNANTFISQKSAQLHPSQLLAWRKCTWWAQLSFIINIALYFISDTSGYNTISPHCILAKKQTLSFTVEQCGSQHLNSQICHCQPWFLGPDIMCAWYDTVVNRQHQQFVVLAKNALQWMIWDNEMDQKSGLLHVTTAGINYVNTMKNTGKQGTIIDEKILQNFITKFSLWTLTVSCVTELRF